MDAYNMVVSFQRYKDSHFPYTVMKWYLITFMTLKHTEGRGGWVELYAAWQLSGNLALIYFLSKAGVKTYRDKN